MPTGYTDCVANGEVTSFKVYALRCAGASDDIIEFKEFKEAEHYQSHLADAEHALLAFRSATEEDLRKMHTDEHAASVAYAKEQIARVQVQRDRYESMLRKAKAFTPPTAEHNNFAEFLIDQLQESIELDCDISYYENLQIDVPFAEWHRKKLDELTRSVEYRANALREERTRVADCNLWMSVLREAVAKVGD